MCSGFYKKNVSQNTPVMLTKVSIHDIKPACSASFLKKKRSDEHGFLSWIPAFAGMTGVFLLLVSYPTHAQTVRISSLADMNLGTWDKVSNMTQSVNVCAYEGSGDSDYYMTFTGGGAGGAFESDDGASNTIAYRVFYKGDTAAGNGTEMTAGNRVMFSGVNTSSSDCSTGGLSGKITIQVDSGTLSGNTYGTYTDTLTVLIEPN